MGHYHGCYHGPLSVAAIIIANSYHCCGYGNYHGLLSSAIMAAIIVAIMAAIIVAIMAAIIVITIITSR